MQSLQGCQISLPKRSESVCTVTAGAVVVTVMGVGPKRGQCTEYACELARNCRKGSFIIIVAAQCQSHDVIPGGNPVMFSGSETIIHTVNENTGAKGR